MSLVNVYIYTLFQWVYIAVCIIQGTWPDALWIIRTQTKYQRSVKESIFLLKKKKKKGLKKICYWSSFCVCACICACLHTYSMSSTWYPKLSLSKQVALIHSLFYQHHLHDIHIFSSVIALFSYSFYMRNHHNIVLYLNAQGSSNTNSPWHYSISHLVCTLYFIHVLQTLHSYHILFFLLSYPHNF